MHKGKVINLLHDRAMNDFGFRPKFLFLQILRSHRHLLDQKHRADVLFRIKHHIIFFDSSFFHFFFFPFSQIKHTISPAFHLSAHYKHFKFGIIIILCKDHQNFLRVFFSLHCFASSSIRFCVSFRFMIFLFH